MKVYTLTGKSGTGKSYQALNICGKMGIDGLIDDGLYIYKNGMVSGKSAKREKTKIGAVKRAIFYDEDHRKEVAKAILTTRPEKILILGTSRSMTDKIIERLSLPIPTERIYIEDITSESDRKLAQKQRKQQGKHVIPLAIPQLKREFAGYFLDPIKLIKDIGAGRRDMSGKTVIRPSFSYMGEFFISDGVIDSIATLVAREYPWIKSIGRIYENTTPEQLEVSVELEVYGKEDLFAKLEAYQRRLRDVIEKMTAFYVVEINLRLERMAK